MWSLGIEAQYGFLYTPGQPRVDLPLPSDRIATIPSALNNAGHVVGRNMDANYESQTFHYTPELGMVHLTTAVSPPLDWWGMQPVLINDADQIVINADGGTSQARSAVLALVHLGDLNCDGVDDFADINPFMLALSDPSAFQLAYPLCFIQSGDVNGDGSVDFDDIDSFITLLAD